MARRAEPEEVKAFKLTLKGLPPSEYRQFLGQFKELISAVSAAKARNEVRKSLATLPTSELQAEIDRRKAQKSRK